MVYFYSGVDKIAYSPQYCTPRVVQLTPVQMMISSRSGLIRWTVLRETISREALPRPFFDAPLLRRGRISPSAFDWNRSTC